MSSKGKTSAHQDAVTALASVLTALHGLEADDLRWVVESACRKVGLATPRLRAGKEGDDGQGEQDDTQDDDRNTDKGHPSPKEFMRRKSPRTDVHKVACLAFYLSRYRNQREFKTADLTTLNNDADGVKIGNATQAVNNAAKQSHFFSSVGKGKKRITTLCEDVVDALPDHEKAKQIIVEKGPKRRKPRASKKGPSTKN